MRTKAELRAALGGPIGTIPTRTASGLCLHRDNKTGALSMRHGANSPEWDNLVPNAFALPAGPMVLGGSCPGATESCRDCYALTGLEIRRAFRSIVTENLRVVREAHEQGRLVEVLLEAVDLSVSVAQRFGVPATFRWHSDGDIFADWYARAIRQVALARPDVEMWVYTRSFVPGASHLGALVGRRRPANLQVFISVDVHNVGHAARQLARFARHGVRAAILADGAGQRRAIEARLQATSVTCPATGKYAHDRHGSSFLVGLDGRRAGIRELEVAQGACAACGLCLRDDPRNITFNLHGGRRSPETAVRILAQRAA